MSDVYAPGLMQSRRSALNIRALHQDSDLFRILQLAFKLNLSFDTPEPMIYIYLRALLHA
jgi:hypothetical protein